METLAKMNLCLLYQIKVFLTVASVRLGGASRCSEFWSSATCKPSAPCVAYDDQIHPRLGANALLVLAENGLIRTPCGLSLHTNSTLGNEAT
jgi:hypothetical protein